ncbi:MAG: deoxyribonuclease IV [Eubacteriaceae bacterium]|jgi:deoxyribonuclease-4
MITIGPHVSIAKGFLHAAKDAKSMGANTFQYFTRNPRGGAVKALDPGDLEACRVFMEENSFGPILAHAPYTLNMASSKEETRDFAFRAFTEDLERMESIPCSLYNFHPGSHTGDGVDTGIDRIIDILNRGLRPEFTTTVLLETMAGKGTEIGRSFEEVRRIIDGTELSDKLGVCLDTCHVFSAGYDLIREPQQVLEDFDRIIGLDRLRAIHLNDSKMPFAAHKDRHEKLGDGEIGLEAIRSFVCSPAVRDVPMFLETPNDNAGYAREIRMIREIRGEA